MFKKASVIFSLSLLAAGMTAMPLGASAADEPANVITLRAESQQLEQDMYTIYNKLNSSDEFDVACGEQKVTGSTIPEWRCEAAFMRNAATGAMAGRWDNALSGASTTRDGFIPQSSRQLSNKNRKKVEQLNEEMMSLARQHPELGAAMIALHAKRQELEKAGK